MLDGDADPEGDPLTAVLVAQTTGGVVDLNDDSIVGGNTVTVALTVNAVSSGPNLSHGVVNVGSAWETVNLTKTYTSIVVVATPNYDSGDAPGVVRIQNAAGNSFQIRVDAAGATAVGTMDVHYVVMEEGVYDEAGYKIEAVKFTSTVTDENNSWSGESRSYQQAYASPVVVGQVMTYNDPAWSVFWAAGGSRTSIPSGSALTVGKHVGEDGDTTRADEMIGYIVIETNASGTAQIEGLPYVAAVGGDTIRGMDNSPGYDYSYAAMANSKTAVGSLAGMDGGDGGWAVLYGTDPITPTGSTLRLAIDEDQLGNSERSHTTEQVAYFIIDPPPASAALEAAPPKSATDYGRSMLIPAPSRTSAKSLFPEVNVRESASQQLIESQWSVDEWISLTDRDSEPENAGTTILSLTGITPRRVSTSEVISRLESQRSDFDGWLDVIAEDLLEMLS